MILANGTVYDTARQGDILGVLEDQINATLASRRLEAETVVAAIHTLGERLAAGAFAPLLARLELDGTERYMEQLIPMLRREALEYKLQVELGRDAASYSTKPPGKLPLSPSSPPPWECCFTSRRVMWTACPLTAWPRACLPGISTS